MDLWQQCSSATLGRFPFASHGRTSDVAALARRRRRFSRPARSASPLGESTAPGREQAPALKGRGKPVSRRRREEPPDPDGSGTGRDRLDEPTFAPSARTERRRNRMRRSHPLEGWGEKTAHSRRGRRRVNRCGVDGSPVAPWASGGARRVNRCGQPYIGGFYRGCLVSCLRCHSLPRLRLGKFDQVRHVFGLYPQLWQYFPPPR